MRNIGLYIVILCIAFSCKEQQKVPLSEPEINLNVDDSKYIIDSSFAKGDVRRYGITPNQPINNKHLDNVIKLADSGLQINFPRGHYNTNLILVGLTDANFIFNDAIIDGYVNIIENDNSNSQRIKFDGSLTILDKLFIRNSNDLNFDTVELKTDTIQNITKHRNRGVSIYVGSKNISFNTLTISDTGGSEDELYINTASSLQVHGWNNNPENIYIKHLNILNADRTGMYLTGRGHKIEKATITNFGLGTSKNMFGLEDAAPGEEKEFSGVWLNKCNNCKIDTLIVNNTLNNGDYSVRLDEGNYHEPTFIYNIRLLNTAKNLPIKDDKLTNILVKHEF